MEEFSEKELRDKHFYIFRAERALGGLQALLKMAEKTDCLSEDDVFGIGEILLMIKESLEMASNFEEE